MCGITGFWTPRNRPADADAVARAMGNAIAHRGPDADGLWRDDESGVAFCHRRLSILDLSPAGAQPMVSESGRYVIVYNGEIYNHLDLRRELDAQAAPPAWRGHSDTETLLALIERKGFEAAIKTCAGMFALAMWDRRDRTLTLARDRIGEKPLYYGFVDGGLVFGSELKALRAFPGFDTTIAPDAVAAFFQQGYVPAPLCIYRAARKLEPGCYVVFGDPRQDKAPAPTAYWRLDDIVAAGADFRRAQDHADAAEATEALLTDVISSQMLSDVPLGAFLSGGIDSSLVTALMQKGASRPVRTFSIGFGDSHFNEAPIAAAVARHLGTDHTELILGESDARALVPALPTIYDEPFADSSQIPTILLARMARAHVTVALSGDGGDEIFGGYNRYMFGPALHRRLAPLPAPVRNAAALVLRTAAGGEGARTQAIRAIAQKLGLPRTLVERLNHLASIVASADGLAGVHEFTASIWPPGENPALGAWRADRAEWTSPRLADLSSAEKMMVVDALTYLPDDIMAKVDRAAMSASLESRAPFLDMRVVDHAWRLPISQKIDGRTGKRILRTILAKHVPSQYFERPKQGFAVPIDRWLREDLRDWADALLTPQALAASGLVRADQIVRVWRAHLDGRGNFGAKLWAALMLQAWLGAR